MRNTLEDLGPAREAAPTWIGQFEVRVRPSEITTIRLNTLQRVLLYAATSIWFMVYVLSQQRNYQDAWILDGILWPFVGLIAVFLIVLSVEQDNRVVALLVAWTILVVTMIPSLKYTQPYGSSIDATDHYLMVQNLMANGSVLKHHTYSTIPAMHAWLASFGLAGDLSAARTIQFGLPLTGALVPLLIYWWTRGSSIPGDIAKYTIAASCLSTFPYYLPNGTGFTLVPLILFLAVVYVREYRSSRVREQVSLTIVALLTLFQITFWHSTTPILLPLVLAVATLTPIFTWAIRRFKRPLNLRTSFVRMSLLALVMFFGYRMLRDDLIFQELFSLVSDQFTAPETTQVAVPPKVFEVTMQNAVLTTWLIRGRAMLLYGLTAMGVLVVWRYRARLQDALPFYVYILLTFVVFAALLAFTFATGVSYTRFLALTVAFTPFFAGPFLWWVRHKLMARVIRSRTLLWVSSTGLVALLIASTLVDFFSFQPLVPRVQGTESAESEDYLVWLHAVNTAYQQRMMTFAEYSTNSQTHFAMDLTGQKQFMRYFGSGAAIRRRLYLPLYRHQEIDPNTVGLFLLHWPGPAGGLGEKVDFRSTARIRDLRETPNWGLVYDNGESFILWIR